MRLKHSAILLTINRDKLKTNTSEFDYFRQSFLLFLHFIKSSNDRLKLKHISATLLAFTLHYEVCGRLEYHRSMLACIERLSVPFNNNIII